MDLKKDDIAKAVKDIARLEANGDVQEASNIRQELFTNGVDYVEIDSMVETASRARARDPKGRVVADDKTTPKKNEAYVTGKSPAEKKPEKGAPVVVATPVTAKKTPVPKKTPTTKKSGGKKG